MTKWKKSWKQNNNDDNENDNSIIPSVDETVEMRDKMKKIRKKRENPRNIVEFENIYEPPQPSSNMIEGMEDKKDGDTKKKIDGGTIRFSTAFDPTKTKDPIAGLEDQLSGITSSLDGLQDIGGSFQSMGDSFKNIGDGISGLDGSGEAVGSIFSFDKNGIQEMADEAGTTAVAVTNIITFVINIFGKKLTALRLQIQIFLLYANEYVRETITRMANALTGDTATETEIDTFQDQTQKFITLLLVWYFVYNWYYIIFFLDDNDNMRYSFKFGDLKKTSKYLYGFFGPGLKSIEVFNNMILYCKKLQNNEYFFVPSSIIMIMMFFVFFVLVQLDFQTSLLKDFFGALKGKPTPSILSLFNICVVTWFSGSWFFGKLTNGDWQAGKLFTDAYPGGIWSIAFACVIFVLAFLGYFLWIMLVNIPIGMTLLTSYLVLYTFLGVFFYEGFNCFNIMTGISDSITPISPDLTTEACKPDAQFLSFDWFYYKMIDFFNFLKSMVNFASASMFEIIILLTLLGGISVYRKEWTGATIGKVGFGPGSLNNLSSVFKHLFAWLILINVILIIIMIIFMVKKYKVLTDLEIGDGDDLAAKDQTIRSRMAAKNSSFKSDGPALNMRAQNRINAQRGTDEGRGVYPNSAKEGTEGQQEPEGTEGQQEPEGTEEKAPEEIEREQRPEEKAPEELEREQRPEELEREQRPEGNEEI